MRRIDELFGQNARDRLTEVKRGLRAILDLLLGTAARKRPPGRFRACLRTRRAGRSRRGQAAVAE